METRSSAGQRRPSENAAIPESDALPLEGLLDRVRAVVPLVSSRAGDAERQRKPDDDVVDALKATGVFRSFVPERYGGYEIGMDLGCPQRMVSS